MRSTILALILVTFLVYDAFCLSNSSSSSSSSEESDSSSSSSSSSSEEEVSIEIIEIEGSGSPNNITEEVIVFGILPGPGDNRKKRQLPSAFDIRK